jgi:hypothetical protein
VTEIILQNDVNVKDEGRLINAGFKLTPYSKPEQFKLDTKAIPAVMCGVEESTTFSFVDMITCIRDLNGVNRLATNTIIDGFTLPSKNQTLFNFSDNAISDLSPAFTVNETFGVGLNKKLYVTAVYFGNTHAAQTMRLQVVPAIGAQYDLLYTLTPASTGVFVANSGNILFSLNYGDVVTVRTTIGANDYILNVYGFTQ